MQPRDSHPWSRDPAPGIAVLVASIALACLVALTAGVLFFPAFQHIDARISDTLRGVDSAALEAFALSLSLLGSPWVMAALTVAGVLGLLVRGNRSSAALLAGTMVLGTAAGSVLKEVVERARPGLEVARIPVPETYSFPSGHALAAFLFFGIVAFLFFVLADSVRVKLWAWLVCSLLAFGVALSRVYLGVHYLGDIIASWMLGSVFLMVAVSGHVLWVTRKRVE